MENIHKKALSYAGALFLVILSILAIMVTIFVFKGQRSYDQNTISVTGTAELSGAPDVATFSFSVSEVADTPEEAQEVISEKVSTILDGLEDLDIDEDDIKTNSYTINPKYEWVKVDRAQEISPDGIAYYPGDNKQVLVGYDVRQSMSVKLYDLEQAAEALTLFAAQGVENLYGPNFEIDDPEGLQEQARLEAIADAKEKAKRLAKDLDVRLGKIVSFDEHGGKYYPQPFYARAEMASMDIAEEAAFAPEIPAGENEISSTVTITYKIK
jgi:uncharacterized protein YggE